MNNNNTVPSGEKFITAIVFLFSSGIFDPRILPQLGSFKLNDFIIAPCCFIGVLILFSKCRPQLGAISWPRLSLLFAFYLFVGMSIVWSQNAMSGFMRYGGFALVSVWCIYLVLRYQIEEILRILMVTLFCVALLSTFFAIFVPSIGVMSTFLEQGDWSGVYRQKNTFGRQMMLMVMAGLFLLTNYKKDTLSICAVILGVTLVIMSGSRTAYGLLILGLFFMLVIHFIERPMVFSFILISGTGGAIFGIYQVLIKDIPPIALNVENLALLGTTLPMTGRIGVWQYAAEWIEKSPWFGYGYDGFWKVRQKLDGMGEATEWMPNDAHNGYVDIVLQLGFIGLVVFILIYFLFFLIALTRSMKKDSLANDRFALFVLSFFFWANLTESYFLKATNIMQILFSIIIIMLCKPVLVENKQSAQKVVRTHALFRKQKTQ